MSEKPTFHVIAGTPAPDTPDEQRRQRLVRSGVATGCLTCHRCGGMTITEVKTGMRIGKSGKPVGGTRQWICTLCHMKGQWVVVR